MRQLFLSVFLILLHALIGHGASVVYPLDGELANHYRLVPYSFQKRAVTHDGVSVSNQVVLGCESAQVADFEKLGRAQLVFERGRLVKVDFPTSAKAVKSLALQDSSGSIKISRSAFNLWRKPGTSDAVGWAYWANSKRLRLWYFNPNGAGALFAEIVILCVALVVLNNRLGLWRVHIAIIGLISMALLIKTGSRGSLLSLMLGFCVLIFLTCVRQLNLKRMLIVAGGVVGVSALAVIAICQVRHGLITIDASNMQRILAWGASPAMLASAPSGWGANPGMAYCDWFQPLNDSHPLYYLVNTHLTWMVQYGWYFSFAYMAMWGIVFVALFRDRRNKWSVLAFVVWFVWFWANWFSTVGIFLSLWILPIGVLVPPLCREWKCPRHVVKALALNALAAVVISALILALLVVIGKHQLACRQVAVGRNSSGIICVGNGPPETIVIVDRWALTHFVIGSLGHDVRSWYKSHPESSSMAFVNSLDEVPEKTERLVLSGDAGLEYYKRLRDPKQRKSLPQASHLIFLSPPFSASIFSPGFFQRKHAEIWTGALLSERIDEKEYSHPWFHRVDGAELYLPNWVGIALGRVEQ